MSDEAPVVQMSYKDALDYGIFAINTWMSPDASDGKDIMDLEFRSEEVIATLADIRDVVQDNGIKPESAAAAGVITPWAARARALEDRNEVMVELLDDLTGGACDSHEHPEPTCSVCIAVGIVKGVR